MFCQTPCYKSPPPLPPKTLYCRRNGLFISFLSSVVHLETVNVFAPLEWNEWLGCGEVSVRKYCPQPHCYGQNVRCRGKKCAYFFASQNESLHCGVFRLALQVPITAVLYIRGVCWCRHLLALRTTFLRDRSSVEAIRRIVFKSICSGNILDEVYPKRGYCLFKSFAVRPVRARVS